MRSRAGFQANTYMRVLQHDSFFRVWVLGLGFKVQGLGPKHKDLNPEA